MIFCTMMIFLMIHKISYHKVRVSTGGVETRCFLCVVVVVSLFIHLTPRAHNVSGP